MEFQSPSERLWKWLRRQKLPLSLRRFARDLKLAHPAHWLILAALTALLAANGAPNWTARWPHPFNPGPPPATIWAHAADLAGLLCWPLAFLASVGAIYLAFSTVAQPFRKFAVCTALPIVPCYLLPMMLSTIATNVPRRSVIEPLELTLPGDIGPAPILAAVALATLAVVYWRAGRGAIPLPISFAIPSKTHDEAAGTRALKFFALTMVLGIASANLIDAVSWFLSRLHSTTGAEALPLKPEEIPVSLILLNWLPLITGTLVVTVAALILWGKDWPLRLRDCLRGARWQDFAIAIGAAVAIHLVARTISYGLLRGALGISEDFRISAVFGLPRWRSLAFFLPALLEEIGWRAYFQTHLIRRFGIRRGLILVGVAWGAWHLQGDLASSTTLAGTALVVFARLINTTVMAGVFGWLYLRSGSVLPVTFLHFGLNVLASTPFFGYPLPIYFSFILTLPPAIALAWYLFSVYPPTETQPPEPPLEKAEGAGA